MPAVVLKFATTVPLLLGTGPGVPVMLTEPSVPTSMPYWALPVNSVCGARRVVDVRRAAGDVDAVARSSRVTDDARADRQRPRR